MALSRTRFNILTDAGGTFVDTGPAQDGLLTQIALSVGSLTPNTNIKLECINSGVVVANWPAAAANDWSRVPRVDAFDSGGTATGESSYFSLVGDRLRLTVTNDTGFGEGVLYAWIGE